MASDHLFKRNVLSTTRCLRFVFMLRGLEKMEDHQISQRFRSEPFPNFFYLHYISELNIVFFKTQRNLLVTFQTTVFHTFPVQRIQIW